MAYSCTLYMNTSGEDYINKVLNGGASLSCEFKAPIDVENPVVYVSGGASLDRYNYMYIPEFGRYYYAKAVGGTGNTITFECKSDPLMSFKTQLLSCPAVISRNPWHFDLYLPDSKLPIESRSAGAVLKFPNTTAFDGQNYKYVLTCLGSGVTVPSPTP